MTSLYFNDDNEPDEFLLEFKKTIKEIAERNGKCYIDINYSDKDNYDRIMNNLMEFNNEKVRVFGTSKNNIIVTVENDESDDLNEEAEPREIEDSDGGED